MALFTAYLALLFLSSAASSPLWLRPDSISHSRSLEEYLLPKSLVPTRYDIHLIPYLDVNFPTPEKKFTFDGVVTIRIICREDTSFIKMHAFDIDIASLDMIKVKKVSPEEVVQVKSFTFSDKDDDRHFFTIELEQPLTAQNTYDVEITYIGHLNEDMEGFYRSSYMEGGVQK
jgi:aminopeptidase N